MPPQPVVGCARARGRAALNCIIEGRESAVAGALAVVLEALAFVGRTLRVARWRSFGDAGGVCRA
jgi:hypothetical protein